MSFPLRAAGFVGGGILIGFAIWFLEFSTKDDLVVRSRGISPTQFDEAPAFVGLLPIEKKEKAVQPFSVALHQGNLLVSFLGSDEILEYSSDLKRHRSIRTLGGEDASLTDLLVEGDRLYATNFRSGELLVLEYPSGKFITAFGLLPDGRTHMKLFGLAYASGSLYASNPQNNQILAISTQTIPGVREEGEVLIGFPAASAADFQLSFPTFAAITPDGRLLVSDVGNREIKAFTCSGRPAHRFDTSAVASFSAPMGIAMDDLYSTELVALADSVFNPSGIFHQGRIHVVDARQAHIKVFNALGKYVLSYGRELRHPNGIAIEHERRLIFVADSELRAVAVYKY